MSVARPLRVEYDGAVYHVTSRGNARQLMFMDDPDCLLFLEVLEKSVERFGWLCHAYCLMGNHYHLLLETPVANLSRGMQWLNGVYTQKFNKRHDRVGHVVQGRFKGILVERDVHLRSLTRYVVQNPVRADIVADPADYRWSSFRATAGLDPEPPFLTTDWLLSQFGDDAERARADYRDFVQEGMDDDPWEELRSGMYLCSERFMEGLAEKIGDSREDRELKARERLAARPPLDDLLYGARSRDARDRGICDAVLTHGYTQKEVADYMDLHYSTVSHIVKTNA